VRLLEEILYRDEELSRELTEGIVKFFYDGVRQRIALHLLDALAESLGGIVESMKHHVLKAQFAELRDRFECGRVKGDVCDQREGRISLQKSRDGRDVHRSVSSRVKNDDADGLSAAEGFELLPRSGDEELLASEDVRAVGEEPRGQERRNAQLAVALMI